MIEDNRQNIWDSIIQDLYVKNIELWDYEKMDLYDYDYHFFYNETHLSYKAAQEFSKIIKKRIIN